MKVFGADFSGAKDPGKRICYAEGILVDKKYRIEKVVQCDDRTDLLAAIHFTQAPWGLDFPFSITLENMQDMEVESWPALVDKVARMSRDDFIKYLSPSAGHSYERRCKVASKCCRSIDASVNAFSPLKSTNPNMLVMTYSGLKLLSYLHRLGNAIYPFDRFDASVSRIYEVYPSHTWNSVGLKRSDDLSSFAEAFNQHYGFSITFEEKSELVDSQDAADAVVAAVTLAYRLSEGVLEPHWTMQHDWIDSSCWENRYDEGLLVRL